MTTHRLKTLPQYFEQSLSGMKPFELRCDDRNFQLGDLVELAEWDEVAQRFTGRELLRRITYIARDVPAFGLRHGYCVLALMPWARAAVTGDEGQSTSSFLGVMSERGQR